MLAAEHAPAGTHRLTFADFGMSSGREALIRRGTRERWNILFCGEAASGKTRFMNACLALAPASERLLVIEEAREIEHRAIDVKRVSVGLPGPDGRRVGYPAAIGAMRRMQPDRVLFGELGHESCATAVQVLLSGQQGFWSTVQAAGPALALDAVVKTAAESRAEAAELHEAMTGAVDLVVELSRIRGTEPWVSNVRRVSVRAGAHDLLAAG